VGEGEIHANAHVLERTQGTVEMEVRMGTGEGEMDEKAKD
jgi:hypothetical protein